MVGRQQEGSEIGGASYVGGKRTAVLEPGVGDWLLLVSEKGRLEGTVWGSVPVSQSDFNKCECTVAFRVSRRFLLLYYVYMCSSASLLCVRSARKKMGGQLCFR